MKRELEAPAQPTKAGIISQVLSKLILGMVRHPKGCELQRFLSPSGSLEINILPMTADYPIVCGKGGKQIRALQLVAERMGANDRIGVTVNLIESFKGKVEPRQEFVWDPEFDVDAAMEFLAQILSLTFPERMPLMVDRQASDKLRIWADVKEEDQQLLSAICDLFYPWAYRQGMYALVKPLSQRPKH